MAQPVAFSPPVPTPVQEQLATALSSAERDALAILHGVVAEPDVHGADPATQVNITVADLFNLESALTKMETLTSQVDDAVAALMAQQELAEEAEQMAKAMTARADLREGQAREALNGVQQQIIEAVQAALVAQGPQPEEES